MAQTTRSQVEQALDEAEAVATLRRWTDGQIDRPRKWRGVIVHPELRDRVWLRGPDGVYGHYAACVDVDQAAARTVGGEQSREHVLAYGSTWAEVLDSLVRRD